MIYWIFENAEPDSVKMIVAPYPATAVLEINAGDVKAKGIEIGDMVEYKLFPVEKAAAADANEVADEGQDEDDTPVETVVEEDKAEIEETVAEDEKAAAENAAPSEEKQVEATEEKAEEAVDAQTSEEKAPAEK